MRQVGEGPVLAGARASAAHPDRPQEALIHLGAKFSPCMRQDPQVYSFIRASREREKHSACCVRNDRSGCVQTSEEECSVCAPACNSHPVCTACLLCCDFRWSPLSFTLDLQHFTPSLCARFLTSNSFITLYLFLISSHRRPLQCVFDLGVLCMSRFCVSCLHKRNCPTFSH